MSESRGAFARLEEHRRLWKGKPVLQPIYAVWFEALLRLAPPGARVLEVGAGPGLLSEYVRRRRPDLHWTATDLVPAPWNQVAVDAQRLPVRDRCLDAVLGLDLVHHLGQPALFFVEVARVLRPGGCLGVVEPWVTPLSYPVYRWFHQEGCNLGLDPWQPFAAAAGKDPFEGDAAVPRRLVAATSEARWRELGLRPPRVECLNGFAYLLSLGFREASLLPAGLAPALLALDRGCAGLARWFGLRALVRWTTLPGAPGRVGEKAAPGQQAKPGEGQA